MKSLSMDCAFILIVDGEVNFEFVELILTACLVDRNLCEVRGERSYLQQGSDLFSQGNRLLLSSSLSFSSTTTCSPSYRPSSFLLPSLLLFLPVTWIQCSSSLSW